LYSYPCPVTENRILVPMHWFTLDGFKRKWMGRLLVVLVGVAAQPHQFQPRQVQREKSLPWVDSATRTAIDKIFAPYATQDSPGYVLGLIKSGNLVFAKGYGQANLDDGIALTPRTAFHLASLSKQFTGAAVALLILSGKLSLEDPISKYIPETAKYGSDLRVKHLVYMTSGLHEYTDLPRRNGLPWMAFYYFTRNEAISAALKPDKLEFPPGTQWAYRNINYMILTEIVEKISGQSYAGFMREKVFRPLGMLHSDINDDTTLIIPHRATGYAPRADPQVIKALAENGIQIRPGKGWVRLLRVSPHYGGSGVFSTLEDLTKWDANWYAPKLVGDAFTALMNKRMRFQHDKDNDAFGLVWRELYGRQMLDYSGGDTDTSTYMARFPAEQFTIICLSNMPLGQAEEKSHQVLELLHQSGKI
jgi:CubicO group peptidase (beta-lactamase class C family)